MPNEPIITECTIPYEYNGKKHTMLVIKERTEFATVYHFRTKKGRVTMQYYDYRWNSISTLKMDYMLAQLVGDAIHAAQL